MSVDHQNMKKQNVEKTSGDEIKNGGYYSGVLPEEQIQRIIFDDNYMSYIQNKKNHQMDSDYGVSGDDRFYPNHGREKSPYSDGDVASQIMSTDELLSQHQQQTTLPVAQMQQAAMEKQKALQFVQYECIKSELKEEYEKKVGFLHKRLSKKAQVDPSFMLMNNLSVPTSTKNQRNSAFDDDLGQLNQTFEHKMSDDPTLKQIKL